jgi:transcriptional regulator with XRE-family HTH domain
MKKTIASPNYEKLIRYLHKEREELGLSMRELAIRLDVPHSWVQRIESLERRLDVYEFVQYCHALDIDPKKALLILE